MKKNMFPCKTNFLFIAVSLCLMILAGATEAFAYESGDVPAAEEPLLEAASLPIPDPDLAFATGMYSYDADSGSLSFSMDHSTFPVDCGPQAGDSETVLVEFVGRVMMWGGDLSFTWVKVAGPPEELYGVWTMALNDFVATLTPKGHIIVTGSGDCEEMGIYGSGFEFQFEDFAADQLGVYTIGEDLSAIDFANEDTPFNLHAYGGKVVITSMVPILSGFFTLTDFAPDHDEPAFLRGVVTGSFSVPNDGSAGSFTATGIVQGFEVNIQSTDAYWGVSPE